MRGSFIPKMELCAKSRSRISIKRDPILRVIPRSSQSEGNGSVSSQHDPNEESRPS